MNYETNVRQLVVLHSMYIFFFMDMQLAKRLFNHHHNPTTKYTSISWYPQALTLIIIHVKFEFFFFCLSQIYLN